MSTKCWQCINTYLTHVIQTNKTRFGMWIRWIIYDDDDDVGEVLSELVVIGVDMSTISKVNSFVEVFEACPIDWLVRIIKYNDTQYRSFMFQSNFFCYKRKKDSKFQLKIRFWNANTLYVYLFDRFQSVLHLLENHHKYWSNKHKHEHHSYPPKVNEFDR